MNAKHTQENSEIKGVVKIRTFRAGTKELIREAIFKNLVVSSNNHGRNIIAQRLASSNTYSLNITHGELGTGTNTPTNADTGLQTGTNRVSTTLATISNNIVTLQFFFSDAALPNGTYNEFGTFVDGSSSLGTGQLFNRVLFSPAYVKATGEDTTIEVEFTIT